MNLDPRLACPVCTRPDVVRADGIRPHRHINPWVQVDSCPASLRKETT